MVGLASLCLGMASQAAPPVDFTREVLPILSEHCFPCHGPDEGTREAGLRLDSRQALLDSGILVPGDPDRSLMVERVFSEFAADRMPPPEAKIDLAEEQKDTLRRWIAEGATYRQHWAFEPLPAQVDPPNVDDEAWCLDPLDRFILSRLEREGFSPNAAASKERWLRRVSYDLNGLPPTPEERAAFLADESPDARARVVDRLLASPRYGEHFAVPWLDAVRYADSYGYQSDRLSPTWPFRDWVVRAFQDDLPYDQFLTWQLAGDLLPNATRDQRLATAAQRLHRMTNEGGSIEQEFRVEYAADRVNTFGTAMLGLTLECARCHDHKFDPVSQREYYSLFAYFHSIDEWGMYNDSARVPTPSLLLPTPEQEAELLKRQEVVAEALRAQDAVVAEAAPRFEAWLQSLADSPPITDPLPDCRAHYSFDAAAVEGGYRNQVDESKPARSGSENVLAEGRRGSALQLTGDHPLHCADVLGSLPVHRPFTVAFWLWLPEDLEHSILFHRTGGTDVGFHGVECSLHDRKLRFSIQRFWPGNALAVEAHEPLPGQNWVSVVASWDASFTAEGLRLYVDGEPCAHVLRDGLTKLPQHGGSGVTFGERFRDFGLKRARLDDVRLYSRALAPVEVRHLVDGESLDVALADRNRSLLREWFDAAYDGERRQAELALADARNAVFAHRTGFLEIPVMEELPVPRVAHVLARGEYDAPRTPETQVERGVPECLPPLPQDGSSDRLGLAQWLTQPDHPLTARVAVNRLWEQLFGRGLVETSDNLGRQGSPPSHAELLDYLAREFVNDGWSVKSLVRRIVLSATYGQDSARSSIPTRNEDPENVLLARGPSSRHRAEVLRDGALFVAGLLDENRGGPPVSPYQPANFWTENNSMTPRYQQSVGRDLYRRSLYTVWKRTTPMPNLSIFDAPTREFCVIRRSRTNTPLQALVLLNDVAFVEAARVFAARTRQECQSPEQAVPRMFLRTAGRDASAEELELLVALYQQQHAAFSEANESATSYVSQGEHPRDDTLDVVELAALTAVAQTLLNLDSMVWKR